jgi:putative ABC transport system permease protein
MTPIGFALRMATREVRASPRRFLLLTTSVAVGVAALVAINSFTANLRDSVRRQAQALLGADLSLESRQPLPPSADRLIDRLVGRGAEEARVTNFAAGFDGGFAGRWSRSRSSAEPPPATVTT